MATGYIVTEADALESYQFLAATRNSKRLSRYEAANNVHRSTMTPEQFEEAGVTALPTELPEMGDKDRRDLYPIRFPHRLMAFVRAKADMEGVDISDVIFNALEAYIEAPLNAGCVYLTDEEITNLNQ